MIHTIRETTVAVINTPILGFGKMLTDYVMKTARTSANGTTGAIVPSLCKDLHSVNKNRLRLLTFEDLEGAASTVRRGRSEANIKANKAILNKPEIDRLPKEIFGPCAHVDGRGPIKITSDNPHDSS